MTMTHRQAFWIAVLMGFIVAVAGALFLGCRAPIEFPRIKVQPPTTRPVDCPAPPAVRVAR